jgi:hypothetical protein
MSTLRPVGRFALPTALPAGERILWQGAPNWRALARNALHIRGLAIYLTIIVAWVCVSSAYRGDPAGTIAFDTARAALVATVPVALCALYAWLTARASAYTITNRRVVIRMGLALPLTLNLPFAQIDEAALSMKKDGTGDLALKLIKGSKGGLGWAIMWPHTRPWSSGQAQPMLRALPDAATAGQILAKALADTLQGDTVTPVSLAQTTRNVDTTKCQHNATNRHSYNPA